MNIIVNQITNVILGINISQVPASYILSVADDFNFTKEIDDVQYVRQFVTQDMVSNGAFGPQELNKPLYIDTSNNLTTMITNIPSLTTTVTSKTYDFVSYPTKFSVSDVIIGKANYILSSEMYKYVVLDELTNFDLIDVSKNQGVNLSIKSIELIPGGSCTTKAIMLTQPTNVFSIYLEGDSNVSCSLGYTNADGSITFTKITPSTPLIISNVISEAYLKFTNTDTSVNQQIHAYGLLF